MEGKLHSPTDNTAITADSETAPAACSGGGQDVVMKEVGDMHSTSPFRCKRCWEMKRARGQKLDANADKSEEEERDGDSNDHDHEHGAANGTAITRHEADKDEDEAARNSREEAQPGDDNKNKDEEQQREETKNENREEDCSESKQGATSGEPCILCLENTTRQYVALHLRPSAAAEALGNRPRKRRFQAFEAVSWDERLCSHCACGKCWSAWEAREAAAHRVETVRVRLREGKDEFEARLVLRCPVCTTLVDPRSGYPGGDLCQDCLEEVVTTVRPKLPPPRPTVDISSRACWCFVILFILISVVSRFVVMHLIRTLVATHGDVIPGVMREVCPMLDQVRNFPLMHGPLEVLLLVGDTLCEGLPQSGTSPRSRGRGPSSKISSSSSSSRKQSDYGGLGRGEEGEAGEEGEGEQQMGRRRRRAGGMRFISALMELRETIQTRMKSPEPWDSNLRVGPDVESSDSASEVVGQQQVFDYEKGMEYVEARQARYESLPK